VIILSGFSQKELKRGQKLALEKGYPHKAEALNSFITKEDDSGEQRKPKSKVRRLSVRKGNDGISRIKHKTVARSAVQQRPSLHKGKPKIKTLLRTRPSELAA